MYCITDQQIEYILHDIKKNGVEMEDLQLNILDHICCIIEHELGESDDFDLFYKKTITQFYKKELKEIEEETINLLKFKNYYTMKKAMIIGGIISTAAFIWGSFLKVMYWHGASLLITIGVLSLSFIFLPLLVILKVREASSLRDKAVMWLGAAVGILYSMATLFAVMRWPGASPLWFVTVSLSMFVLIPLYFFTGIRKPETKVNTIVTTILLVGATGLLFTMLRVREPMPVQSYAYISNELLLRKIQRNKTMIADSKPATEINNLCEQIKGFILKKDIELTAIPDDIEQKDITIRERNVYIPETSEAFALLARLKEAIYAYNTAQTANENKIPVTHSVLDIEADQLNTCTNLFVLNSLTQVQLSLASNAPHAALSMK